MILIMPRAACLGLGPRATPCPTLLLPLPSTHAPARNATGFSVTKCTFLKSSAIVTGKRSKCTAVCICVSVRATEGLAVYAKYFVCGIDSKIQVALF